MPWMGMFIGGRPTPNLTPALPNFRTFSPRTTRLGMVTHLDNSPGFMVDAFAAKGGAPSPPYFNDPYICLQDVTQSEQPNFAW